MIGANHHAKGERQLAGWCVEVEMISLVPVFDVRRIILIHST